MAATKNTPDDKQLVRIKHAMFTYTEDTGRKHPGTGDPVLIERIAYHGQELFVDEHDLHRGLQHDAFFVEGEPQAGKGAIFISGMSHEDLVTWLKADEPTISEIIAHVQRDPQMAEAADKMIEAEKEATGGDPRSGLIASMEAAHTIGENTEPGT